MGRFIQRENIKHYRALLEQATDVAERGRILKLLADEEAKGQPKSIGSDRTLRRFSDA